MSRLARNRLLVGDVRDHLPQLPAASVDCAITSPPYFRLRNYLVKGQLGNEPSVDEWVHELRQVLREVGRVLKPSGSLWLNLGDTYSRGATDGAPGKSLLLGPERLVAAMIEDGWIVRNKVVWAKTNPMPTSARDRLSGTWEVLYFAVRSPQYFFDLDAIRVPHNSTRTASPTAATKAESTSARPKWAGPFAGSNNGLDRLKAQGAAGHALGKNPGDVWRSATANYRDVHHAAFPERLITPPLLASCPPRVCAQCGLPWRRDPVRRLGQLAVAGELRPTCVCRTAWRPGVVLDPFMGVGTVAAVAEAHGRDWSGIELNPQFARITKERLQRARASRERQAAA